MCCNVKKVTFTLRRAASFEYSGCWTLSGRNAAQGNPLCRLLEAVTSNTCFQSLLPLLAVPLYELQDFGRISLEGTAC